MSSGMHDDESTSSNQAALIAKEKTQKVSMSSPIHHLPLEILGKIFTHFCGKYRCSPVDLPALVLAAVCGSRRDIGFSMPMLWPRMNIQILSHYDLRRLRCLERLANLALENSRGCPLDLDLKNDVYAFETDSVALEKYNVAVSIMASVACHSYQWCHVILSLTHHVLSRMNLSMQDLPLLEPLTIRRRPPLFDMIRTAPKLRHHLDFQLLEPWSSDPALPWAQITSLNLFPYETKIPLSKLLSYVELCTSLQQLELGHSAGGYKAGAEGKVVVHASITSLILTDLYSDSNVAMLLDSFMLPCLNHLGFVAAKNCMTWTRKHALALERS